MAEVPPGSFVDRDLSAVSMTVTRRDWPPRGDPITHQSGPPDMIGGVLSAQISGFQLAAASTVEGKDDETHSNHSAVAGRRSIVAAG